MSEGALDATLANLAPAMLESWDEPIWAVDTAETLTSFNTAFERYCRDAYGTTPAVGGPLVDVVPADMKALLESNLRRALGGETLVATRGPYTVAGELRHYEARYTPLVAQGRVIGLFGHLRDVTARDRALSERKSAEMERAGFEFAMRRSSDLLAQVLTSSGVAIFALDTMQRVTMCNERWSALCSAAYGATTQVGQTLLDRLPPDARGLWSGLLKGGRLSFELALGIHGTVRYFNVTVAPVVAERDVSGVAVFCQEETGRRRAEEALRGMEANLVAVMESSTDPTWAIDAQLRLISFNSAFAQCVERFRGRRPVIGGLIHDNSFMPTDAALQARCERALLGQRFSTEHAYRDGAGEHRVEISAQPIFAGLKVSGVVVVARDVACPAELPPLVRRPIGGAD